MLTKPENLPDYTPGPVPVHRPGKYPFWDHHPQSGKTQAILAKEYV